ncbi:MAG: YIP1 family protein [Acidobacteriota bacterium]
MTEPPNTPPSGGDGPAEGGGFPPAPPGDFTPPPPSPPPGPAPERSGPAWEKRSGVLDLAALLSTMRDVLFRPDRTFSTMVQEGDLGAPLLFYMIVGTVCGWLSAFVNMMFSGGVDPAQMEMFGLGPEFEDVFRQVSSPSYRVGQILLWPAIWLLALLIGAGITHLSLLLFGGARRPFETTLRVIAYTAGSLAIFFLLPVCGFFILLIWATVVIILGLARAHESPVGPAVAAVLLPVGFCCVCALLFLFAGVMSVMKMINA